MTIGEFLLEIGCEELPAEWLDPLIHEFEALLNDGIENAGIRDAPVHCFGTPRRLVAHAVSTKAQQEDRVERKLGPPARVGRTAHGEWTRASLAFARRFGFEGLAAELALTTFDTDRGLYVGIEKRIPGRPAQEILPSVIERALRGLRFPKAMNWDASVRGEPFQFGRPIRWIVALIGGEVVPFEIEVASGDSVVAGNRSRGHRFRTKVGRPGETFEVDSFASLQSGLLERFVVLQQADRERRLRKALGQAATSIQAPSFEAPEFHHHLVEWPGAIAGRYDEEFHALPEEIRRAVLVHHQKYLPVADVRAFLAVVNVPEDPHGTIRRGAERVVRARLRDASFFWDDALSRPLRERRQELESVTFHQRMGNLRDHTERVARVAEAIASRVGADHEIAGEAALLAKCDLTTPLVQEFPSLQGQAGGLILQAQRERDEVWMAVYDQYRPLNVHSDRPQTVEGAAVALADRAATLAGLFAAGEAPSGSGDPFALRRAALGMLSILREAPGDFPDHPDGWPTPADLLGLAVSEPVYKTLLDEDLPELWTRLVAFVSDRLHHALTQPGMPPGVPRAVLSVRGMEHYVADLWQRILALQNAVRTGDYARLAVAHKRARRILTPEGRGVDLRRDLLTEGAEADLFMALKSADREVARLSARGRYSEAFALIAGLGPKVDAFFDDVLVMAEDPAVRANRLALLARLDVLFSKVGDLSQIEASA